MISMFGEPANVCPGFLIMPMLVEAVQCNPEEFVGNNDIWVQLQALRTFLCQRPATPALPDHILAAIERVLQHQQQHRVLVPTATIAPAYHIPSSSVRISLWRGDITTLRDVTAIVNAANSALLGCFQPTHRCIDNVIHSVAGPRLRDACNEAVSVQGHPEPNGLAKATPGFCASAEWIIHTVGPQLRPGQQPSEQDKQDLSNCYASCLDAVERLPPLDDGRVVIAFPCISTGLFCFPADMAARIAVGAVTSWCKIRPSSPLTDIIFNVFTAADEKHYQHAMTTASADGVLSRLEHAPLCTVRSVGPSPALSVARQWLSQAPFLVISAGAGLSAATGLDYTSQELFSKHFPGFATLGLRRLYDAFGPTAWPSSGHKWGYFFTLINLARSWPASPLYESLLAFATERFGPSEFFVRTTNADGLFFANGFPADRVSTPQGMYRYLQCTGADCKYRLDTVVPSAPFVDTALPHIDPETQVLTDASKIPRCARCGAELFMCVRAGAWFNELPYADGEARYREFLIRAADEQKDVVILELGVGLNTPSILRWHNEDLARLGEGHAKLIRVGFEAAGVVDFELVDSGHAIGISGDTSTSPK
ncbi:appr-1-p processing enzyme family protein [Auricularia subglabra TFB-10046 SS5]|nr:appr-1-p processing enzyme family protein [Auricularia subglabra TFB-10046 SS5]